MAPYYGPDEDPATIFLERSFLAGDFIAGVGYGELPHLSRVVLLTSYLPNMTARASTVDVWRVRDLSMEDEKSPEEFIIPPCVYHHTALCGDDLRGYTGIHSPASLCGQPQLSRRPLGIFLGDTKSSRKRSFHCFSFSNNLSR